MHPLETKTPKQGKMSNCWTIACLNACLITCLLTALSYLQWGMESVLMRALRCQQKEVAEYLINNGVDIGYHYTAKVP